MSLASEVIQAAFDKIGRGSELLATDSTLSAEALNILRSMMEDLRKREIILEETVSGTTTTIALPTLSTDELDEPTAAYIHLVNLLAVNLAATSRANPESMRFVPPAKYSKDSLAQMYRQPTIPNIVPSKLLPRGQGQRGRRFGVFFDGSSLDNDVADS